MLDVAPARRWLMVMSGVLFGSAVGAQPSAKPSTPPVEKRPAVPVDLPLPPGTILSPGETPIDLSTALRLAGVQNPELLRARERVTESAAIRQLAAAQLLPNINLGGNFNLHRGALQQSNGNILKVNREALNLGLGASAVGAGTETIPGINYNIHLGDIWYDMLRTNQNVVARTAAARAMENDTLLRVTVGYMDLLRAEGRRSIAIENRDEAAELARLTATYARAGQGRQADADRAAVELRRRDLDLTQAEADIVTASARLCRVLNLDPSTRLKPIDGWVVPAPIVPDPVPLADLLAIALLQRPELAERRAEIQAALYDLASARLLPFVPNLILGFSSDGFGGGGNLIARPQGFINGEGKTIRGPRFGNFDGRTDFDVIVFWQFRNLGVGNIALANIADSRARQSQWRELETLNRVRAEVAEAHIRVQARFAQIDISEKAVRHSRDAFREDLTRIQGGQGLPLEVIDSLRLLARSRYEYLDSIVDYNRAQFQLFVALGQPPADRLARPIPADLVPAPVGPRIRSIDRIPLGRPQPDSGVSP